MLQTGCILIVGIEADSCDGLHLDIDIIVVGSEINKYSLFFVPVSSLL